MSRRAVYPEIIRQVLAAHPAPAVGDIHAFAALAEAVGDDLYRLCIEFGVDWNEFKRDVLAVAADPAVPDSRHRAGWLESVAGDGRIDLVMLALELMPDDGE